MVQLFALIFILVNGVKDATPDDELVYSTKYESMRECLDALTSDKIVKSGTELLAIVKRYFPKEDVRVELVCRQPDVFPPDRKAEDQ
jgi:hypothetical protein